MQRIESTSRQMEAPTFDDFVKIQESFQELVQSPHAQKRAWSGEDQELRPGQEDLAAGVAIEVGLLAEAHEKSHLMISLDAMVRVTTGGHRMEIVYREDNFHEDHGNTQVEHSYEIESDNGQLVEFGHSLSMYPEMPDEEPAESAENAIHQAEADYGAGVLRDALDGDLELTAGEMQNLLQRMNSLRG